METNQFISALIKNLCFECVIPAIKEPKIFFVPGRHEENALLAITEGFRLMQDRDFRCLAADGKRFPIENALSFRWALNVASKIPNATIRFQETSEHIGHVDFHLNGFADCAIEFIRNATLAKSKRSRQSTDVNEHLERFTSGKYHWQRFYIINFALTGQEPVLPTDSRYHNRVFTYVHSTNTLYRGNSVFCKPAVSALACPMERQAKK